MGARWRERVSMSNCCLRRRFSAKRALVPPGLRSLARVVKKEPRKQESWLFSGLDDSEARWNIIPQQVMVAPVDRMPGDEERYSMDQWSGYDAARNRLVDFLGARQPSNPVLLTGDIHSNWVNDIKADFADPDSDNVATAGHLGLAVRDRGGVGQHQKAGELPRS